MKYCLLLPLLIIAAARPALAQRLSAVSIVRAQGDAALQMVDGQELPQSGAGMAASQLTRLPQAKGAGTAIYTQTFPSLPAGWTVTASGSSVNGWRWANTAPAGAGNNYPINGLINSTTKSNGWLLYNADSVLGSSGASRPFGGAITSAAIPLGITHTNVILSFQQYFRYSTGDSCFVDVSSNGTAWTSFPVYPNMSLTQYGFLYHNATTTTFNISSVVGGQANAYVRFRFSSTAAQYSFNWLIDDLSIYDADPIDAGIAYSGIVSASDSGAGFTRAYSYTSIPLRFADTVYPITYLSNYGLSAASNTVITATYYRSNTNTLFGTQTMNVAALPLGARDSAIVFNTGYRPTAAGSYLVALSISPAGDAVAQNNVDTIRFNVTDSAYATYGADFTERNCYLSRPSNSTLQYWGARFTIGNGQHDTITSVSAAFRPLTVAGSRIQAQLYQASGSGTSYSWQPLAVSATQTLAAADISTATNVVFATFPLRIGSGNYAPLILGNGDYAIVLTTVNATNDVAVFSMVPPFPAAPAYIGYQGQSDVSPNDGSSYFAGAGGIATGLVEVPLVRPNFGNARALLAVPEIENIMLGAAFPNPANASVNIPVALQRDGAAQLTLSNAIGQVAARIDLGRMSAGVMKLASLPTGQLPEGVYFYTVTADSGRITGLVTVKH